VTYRHHTPTYVLSEQQEVCFTDITRLHISSHRHTSCVLQTSHVYIYLVTDTAIVSYTHYTSTYVLSETHQLCLTDITRLHIYCHKHSKCLTNITCLHMSCHRHISCVLHTLHAYICLVTDTSIVSYRHYTPTFVLSETHQLCLTDMTRLHMSCRRHIYCILQTSHVYICLVTDTAIISYKHHKPTYVLS
jgi:hypothetical protein